MKTQGLNKYYFKWTKIWTPALWFLLKFLTGATILKALCPASFCVHISYHVAIRSLIVRRSELNVLLVEFSLSATGTLIVLDVIQCKVGK